MKKRAMEICPKCKKEFEAYSALKYKGNLRVLFNTDVPLFKSSFEVDMVICPHCNCEFHSEKIKHFGISTSHAKIIILLFLIAALIFVLWLNK